MIEIIDVNDSRAVRNKNNVLALYDLMINKKKCCQSGTANRLLRRYARPTQRSRGEAQNCPAHISSNSWRHAALKPCNRSIVPSMAISRSSTKLLSGSK